MLRTQFQCQDQASGQVCGVATVHTPGKNARCPGFPAHLVSEHSVGAEVETRGYSCPFHVIVLFLCAWLKRLMRD